jgi:hypothetical protein
VAYAAQVEREEWATRTAPWTVTMFLKVRQRAPIKDGVARMMLHYGLENVQFSDVAAVERSLRFKVHGQMLEEGESQAIPYDVCVKAISRVSGRQRERCDT